MEKYNVKLMNNKKGYLNSFKNELGEKFIFLGFKEERNNFKSEFTKEEIKAIDERYLWFKENKEIAKVFVFKLIPQQLDTSDWR